MTKVKVFVYGRRQQRRRRRRRRGYDNSSPDFRHGELKTIFNFKVKVKVTRSLTLVSIERVSLVEYAC